MLSVYIIPMILRPIDFLKNFKSYIMGMIVYIFMIPTFVNIMSIYSMCNLHDISWGNRPSASSGTNTITENEKK
jgi:chitin synthase